MEDSQATEVTNNQHQRELPDESSANKEEKAETSETDSNFEEESNAEIEEEANPVMDHVEPAAVEPEIDFESFTDTPNLDDVKKEL